MPTCLVSLGANLGDRRQSLQQAVNLLRADGDLRVTAVSAWRETAPIGGPPGQGPFLNGAIVLETALSPLALLDRLRQVEHQLGRRRQRRWEARPLDLDLLLYGEEVQRTAELEVPHPRMAFRRFVLEPAAEVAGHLKHPGVGWTVARLLAHLNEAAPYLAITGPAAAGKVSLVQALAERGGGKALVYRPDPRRLAALALDPAGQAWSVELEFLGDRGRLLDRERTAALGPLQVSNFWLGQSLAYASVWLAADRLAAFEERWQATLLSALAPKLTVLLDAPADVLVERALQRGGDDPAEPRREVAERIRRAIAERARAPGHGPVLRLDAADPAAAIVEAWAAIEAMK